MLDEMGSPGTVALGGGRYFGFVCGGTVPASRAASVLAAAWDQNAAMRVLSPVAVTLEQVAIRWIVELLGLPPETGAALVTGATMASFVCLAAARHQMLEHRGWNVEEQGLFSAPEFAVYVSEEAHSSVMKALALLGLGRSRVVTLPTDCQGRIITTDLPEIMGPSVVCLQAGNVNTGSSDNFAELCEWAHTSGSWVHVDGAFGLWAQATESKRHLVKAVESADSWATDAHKWLNGTYDCGIALVGRPSALKAAMGMTAAYLKFGEAREPAHYGPDLSRRARGVEVWAAIRSLGRVGLAEMIERTCALATRFAEELRSAGYQILNEVVLNQVLVSFGSDELTELVVAELQRDGTCWCGTTLWKGRTAMRISVSSWATTHEDVSVSAERMIILARSLSLANENDVQAADTASKEEL